MYGFVSYGKTGWGWLELGAATWEGSAGTAAAAGGWGWAWLVASLEEPARELCLEQAS